MSHYNSLANEIRKTVEAADVSNRKAAQQEADDLNNLGKSCMYAASVLEEKLSYENAGLVPVPTADIDAQERRIAAAALANKEAIEAQADFEAAAEARDKSALAAAQANSAANG